MQTKISGKGRKRPQIDLPLENLELDSRNPRLAEEHLGGTQLDILRVLSEEFDLEEIAYSMAENGYFDEEPIVVIPKNLPKTFKWSDDTNKTQADLEDLIKEVKNIRFIVIEGNRRIATAMLLTHKALRERIKIRSGDFPTPKKQASEDLLMIPAIVYKSREGISPYLGVRHITGVLKWESYVKAKYITARIEKERRKDRSIEKSIKEVKKKVGDRTDVIKRQYIFYKVFEQARDDINFNTDDIINRFSLITVALGSPSIRNFIGVPSYKDAKFNKPLVPNKKLKNFEALLTWIYGRGKENPPILTDSRKITSHLAPILADREATEYLL
ncbi:MAG: hypothetical protein WBF13_07225, partial [Candidatus Zixiibacteriota bacterium]